MTQKPRIYISSSIADLQEYRKAVREALNRLDVAVVGLEDFGARTEAQPLDTYRNAIIGADIIVLILAYRYGYVPPNMDKSTTELEYDEARRYAKPVFVFLVQEGYPWPPNLIDSGSAAKALESFKKELLGSTDFRFFTTPQDLASKVVASVLTHLGMFSHALDEKEERPEPALSDVLNELRALRSEIFALQRSGILAGPNVKIAERKQETYSYHSADFLGSAAGSIDYNQCFVIMPYSEKWSAGLEGILREVCNNLGVRFVIARTMERRFIPHDIWQGITGSGIIIADLSEANPNVTYEIGLADVLGREVILICQGAKVPFDFLGQRLILYEDSIAGTLKLREELTDHLRRFKERNINSHEDNNTA